MQGLETCRVFILVFSEEANDSDHVEREVAKAFPSGLAVIPFRIGDYLRVKSDVLNWNLPFAKYGVHREGNIRKDLDTQDIVVPSL
jgi:hypothetical protein